MTRIDHAEASSRFIEAKDHLEFHDRRLWDLRKKRDRESESLPEWQELRSLASAIKEHTLTHLADYLLEFERNAIGNGAQVHWATDAAEHNQVVYDILHARGVRTLVKAKSMLTDECEMRPFLEHRGIEVMETDLSTTSRRATSSCRPCTSSAATWRACSPRRSAPTPTTAMCITSPRASASTRARTSSVHRQA
jgi:L-lactate utilization protein LutB